MKSRKKAIASARRVIKAKAASANVAAKGNKLGKAKATSSSVQSETRWRGASRVLRSMSSWLPPLVSGKTVMPPAERNTLVSRSQDAYRNHMIGRAAITRPRTNIVGTGLIAHPSVNAQVLGITEDAASELNSLIATHWSFWAESPSECDIEASGDFSVKQGEVLLASMIGGDAFALSPNVDTHGGMFSLKVQLVDGMRVSNKDNAPNSERLLDGFELAPTGRPVACHIRKRHPADKAAAIDGWDRVEIFGAETGRRRVMQVVNDKDSIGMVRGIPYLAPILEPLQTLETYGRSELIAAVVSAMFTVFLEKESGQFGGPSDVGSVDGQTTDSQGNQTLALGNGAIVDLAPGEKASFANPTRPNANYDPFFLSMVKQIGAALELPLDELLLHYQSSYSAARAAMLQAWRFYSMRRWWLVQQFCAPFYQLWFDEAVARGLIPVTNYADPLRRAAYTNAIWVGPARGAMDELKEANAAAKRIEMGVSNETIETASMMGEPWSHVHAQRARELKVRKASGTMPEKPIVGPATTPAPVKPPKEDRDEPEGDEPTDEDDE